MIPRCFQHEVLKNEWFIGAALSRSAQNIGRARCFVNPGVPHFFRGSADSEYIFPLVGWVKNGYASFVSRRGTGPAAMTERDVRDNSDNEYGIK